MQTWSRDENSACPSVRQTRGRVDCDKAKEKSVHIFMPYERPLSLASFLKKEWLLEATASDTST